MTDTRLRQRERKWKETGAVEDEAAYLLERVRVGDLEKERLELAAYCGYGAAGIALTGELPKAPSNPGAWLARIEALEPPLRARALIGVGRLFLSAEGESLAASRREVMEQAVESAERRIGDPGCVQEESDEPLLEALAEVAVRDPSRPFADVSVSHSARVLRAALLVSAGRRGNAVLKSTPHRRPAGIGFAEIRAAIEQQVVPLLLGCGDATNPSNP